jgi:integration host factor subunit alpha
LNNFIEGDIIMAIGGKAITRPDPYDAVYRSVALSRTESAQVTEQVLKEITDCIARGEALKLSSFGTFTVRKKGQRLGRNPKTGIEVLIEPRRAVTFKASAVMRKQVNVKLVRRDGPSPAAEASDVSLAVI